MTDELRLRRAELQRELERVEAMLAAPPAVAADRSLEEAYEALRQSEARFRTLVEHAPEALVILDVNNGRFVDVSTNACALFGYPREALLTLGPVDVSPALQPDGRPSAEVAVAYIREATQGRHTVFEWTHRHASGDPIPCEVRLVRLPHDELSLVRGSVIDISARKRDEAERERLTNELFQAQKMQAIGQLTGGVAHDFNNLLTIMMGSLELVGLGAGSSPQVRPHLDAAMDAVVRAAALTRRLLAFARKQPLRPRAVNLNRLVAEAEALLRRTLGEAIEIEMVLGAGLWACQVDPTQLDSALLNLAINARDAMPEGGKLTVETANARLDRAYAREHPEVEAGQYVMLAVSDDGQGMDEETRRQAFEPFFTTKELGRGSGLGLSMVYGFVKQSGGHVRIYSEPGEGTTVRIYLPRAHEPASREGPAADHVIERGGAGRLVLVVEDDAAVRGVILEMLERLDYRTLAAEDARSALALVEATPDLAGVLSDVVLPGGVNGPELARRARQRRPGLPVLFMSGYTENAIIHSGRLDPGVALIEKPFAREALAFALAQVLDAPSPPRRE